MRGKAHVIHLALYPFEILVSIGETDTQFKNSLTRHCSAEVLVDLKNDANILSFSRTQRGRTVHFKESGVTMIRMPEIITTPEHKGILAHEIFHAIDFIFHRIGIKLHPKSGEAYAYAIQYLTQQIYTRFRIC